MKPITDGHGSLFMIDAGFFHCELCEHILEGRHTPEMFDR
jgi:hypothetical protein